LIVDDSSMNAMTARLIPGRIIPAATPYHTFEVIRAIEPTA
jgi:hypothetical protein